MNPTGHFAITALFAFVSLGAMTASAADAAFGAPFTSHAVLQRDCRLPVWGSAEPRAKITVALDDIAIETIADAEGAWRVEFPPQTEPGLGHRLSLATNGVDAIVLKDIAIGDIWLCAGQSNMEMGYSWGLTKGKSDIEKRKDKSLRFYTSLHAASFEPLAKLRRPCEWTTCEPEASKQFSACGFFFGQALRDALPDVPIGLVSACWSGSPIRTWIAEDAYAPVDPQCEREIAKMHARRDAYNAEGGLAGFRKRTSKWKAACRAAGDIGAEKVDFDDSKWKTVQLPQTFEKQFNPGFDGCAWYRRTITLTADQAAVPGATLKLGPIDDSDKTYVNGELVGSTSAFGIGRSYKIPDGLLRKGENFIAVRIDDEGGNGGFTSDKPNSLRLVLPGMEAIPLAGEWRSSKGIPYPAKPHDGGPDSWTPSACYNAMLNPLSPMALKGAIWYQGCSDVDRVALYEKALTAMVADWRKRFVSPDGLPFYIVQLAAYRKTHEKPVESNWAAMRWAQTRLGETIEKSGTAVIIDAGDHADIHPKNKKVVGQRLARLARVRSYGEGGLAAAGPVPASAKLEGTVVVVEFPRGSALATADEAAPKGFQLAGADGKFAWAEAAIVGDAIRIAIPDGMEPATVRHAWDDYPDCNLIGADALPCGPFELRIH